VLSPVPDGVTVVASFEKAERLRERKKPDPLLILEPLQEYFDENGFGEGDLLWGRLGLQSTSGTFHLQRDEGFQVVLKRRLGGPQPSEVMDLPTEVELLKMLRGHGLHSPEILHVCNDPSIIGAPFYLSAFLPGEAAVKTVPKGLDSVEEKVGMSRRAIDDLARIQVEITPDEVKRFDRGGGELRKMVLESKRMARQLKMRRIPGF